MVHYYLTIPPSRCYSIYPLQLPSLSVSPSSTQQHSRLQGLRRAQQTLQQGSGLIKVQSQGVSNSQGNVVAGGEEINGVQPVSKAGMGSAGGRSESIGTSNAFIGGQLGAASAGGSSGGNSSALAQLSIASDVNGLGIIESVGEGIGASGGQGVFGPSLVAAIAAATPVIANTTSNTTLDTATADESSKTGQANTETTPMATPAPLVFSFTPGLPTGGGGAGFGIGTGNINATIVSTDLVNKIGKASGGGFANGFGFGVGSGAGQNGGFESAGGSGGGTALGQGTLNFEVDELQEGAFVNGGTTTSVGGSAGYVGYNPVLPEEFFDKLLTIRSPTPVLAGVGGAN
jgi:hypothetical protein